MCFRSAGLTSRRLLDILVVGKSYPGYIRGCSPLTRHITSIDLSALETEFTTIHLSNMSTISEADADAESEEQLDEQFKMANDAITGLSRAIDQAKTTIAERETELSQADPGQVAVLQRELIQLKTQLEKDEAGFATVMSAKGGTREGQVVPVKSFDDILRVSISCIRTRWTTRW